MQLFESLFAELGQYTPILTASLGLIAGAVVFYLLIARALKSLQNRRYLPEQLVASLRRIGLWIVLAVTTLILLQRLGVLHSVITAVTGMFALLAIGFVAVWSVLSNTLCSLILLVIRPYRVGDTLSFPPDDLRGKVVNFNLIFTTLQTEDGCLLQVPNNIYFQRPVVRKPGQWRIGLADQLYESKNATGTPKPCDDEAACSSQAA